MRKHKKISIVGLVLFLLLMIVGCTNNKLSEEKTEVEGKGVSYTFQLPDSWRKQEDFQAIYGTQSVYGAEDTRSNSKMAVVIVAKEDIEEDGFGERTRKDLAVQNGYQDTEGVYFVEDEINGNKVFKYTFETTLENETTWAHYYSIFTEHAVIQFLYYSAQDSSYEDRVKIIDESIETVKEVDYDAEKAEEEAKKEQKDTISFSTDTYEVNIIGLGTLKDNDEKQLVALRFSFTNKQSTEQKANSWMADVGLTQAGKELTETTLSEESTNYDIVRLQKEALSAVEEGKTKEGVLLFETNGQASITLTLNQGVQSEEEEYLLQLPNNE